MIHTPSDWKGAQPAWDYIGPVVALGIPYGWWLSGDVPARDPAWGDNSPPPRPGDIQTMFCAAVGNLMLRALGMFDKGYVIPGEGDLRYDGGTVGWVAYYRSYGTLENFDEDFAANNSGTVCLREFRDASGDQGHWMVSYKGYALQTFPPDGLQWNYTVHESHDGGYYEYMVKPWNWLPITQAEYYGSEPGNGEPASTQLTADLLVSAMTSTRFEGPDLSLENAQRYLPYLIDSCKRYGITNRARLSAFLAQTGAESGSFEWWREFTRGEGKPFGGWYGRGPIQLTWEDNYQQFEDATGHPAHQQREIVADNAAVGFDSAAWYFWNRGLNELAELATWDAFYEITGRVYGVAGPFAERDARYSVAWDALPASLDLSGQTEGGGDTGDGETETWRTDGWWAPDKQGSKNLIYHAPPL